MKAIFSLFAISLFFNLNAGASTLMKCAVNQVPEQGARINLIQSAGGQLRANLIFGTTVSGTMYNLRELKPGVYSGVIKGNEKFWIQLVVGQAPSENRYIRGRTASLEVVYPDLRQASGYSVYKSKKAEEFVCGTQIRGFSE